jgi:P-type Cu+ transporter
MRAMTGNVAESGTGPAHAEIELLIGGMTCAACAGRIEKKLAALGAAASVNLATERARVLAPPGVTAEMLVAAVEQAGFSGQVAGHRAGAGDADVTSVAAGLRRRLILAAIFFIPLSDVSGALSLFPAFRFPGWQWVLVALAAPVVVFAAWPFHRTALVNLRRPAVTMDTLVSLGVTTATGWSVYAMFALDTRRTGHSAGYELVHAAGGGIYLEVAAAVTTFLLAGRYFEARARRSAGEEMRRLVASAAPSVRVVDPDGTAREIPAGELRAGDTFMVRPGERIAADGVVTFGRCEVDRSTLTGESAPVDAAAGDAVSAGTIALTGRVFVRALRVGPDTQVARLIRLIERAQGEKAKVQRLADRISGIFVPAVLVLAAGTALGWLAAGSPARAVSCGLAVLIIACPCALGLATPAALVMACGRGARLGIFIKGYAALESSRTVDTVVLDKTGTLTAGTMSVAAIALGPGTGRTDLLRRAGAIEQASEHCVAAAITAVARAEAGELPQATDFAALPGLGATGFLGSLQVIVGREQLLTAAGLIIPPGLATEAGTFAAAGQTTVLAGWDGQARGAIAIADEIKPSAAGAVADLRALGLRTALLTGDNAATAAVIGGQAGVDEVRAAVGPAEKAAYIGGLKAAGQRVAMVGDGVNDGPALAAADLAIAMGSGTDVAISAADIIVLRDDLGAVPEAIQLARATHRTIRRNLVWAFGYNVAAIPLAASGYLNPLVAAAAMTLSSSFVVWNSLRLRRAPLTPARDRPGSGAADPAGFQHRPGEAVPDLAGS